MFDCSLSGRQIIYFGAQIMNQFDSPNHSVSNKKSRDLGLTVLLPTENVCCACVAFSFLFRLEINSSIVNISSFPTRTSSSLTIGVGHVLEIDKPDLE